MTLGSRFGARLTASWLSTMAWTFETWMWSLPMPKTTGMLGLTSTMIVSAASSISWVQPLVRPKEKFPCLSMGATVIMATLTGAKPRV